MRPLSSGKSAFTGRLPAFSIQLLGGFLNRQLSIMRFERILAALFMHLIMMLVIAFAYVLVAGFCGCLQLFVSKMQVSLAFLPHCSPTHLFPS